MREATIELQKDSMKFSSAHFTILSPTTRERLHGHNFVVHAAITTLVNENGMTFDYRFYKKRLNELCRTLNEAVLLPENSEHLTLVEEAPYLFAEFNDERIPFLPSDVVRLPVTNITVEELSNWFIQQLLVDKQTLEAHRVQALSIKVFTSPGQSGTSCWRKS